MKKTSIYFVASSGVFDGKPDFGGAIAFKNTSDLPASAELAVSSFETGEILRTVQINLAGRHGVLFTNVMPELSGLENRRLTLELDGSDFIEMEPLNYRRLSPIGPLNVITKK